MSVLSAPTADAFAGDHGLPQDFAEASDLAYRADQLMAADPNRFGPIANLEVAYLWKRRGGKSRGQLTLGKCKKATGDLRFFSGMDAVIWLAADHHAGLSDERIEATLFHELLHLGVDEESGLVELVGHDFEGFAAEVVKYGAILDDVQAMAGAFHQLALFAGEP